VVSIDIDRLNYKQRTPRSAMTIPVTIYLPDDLYQRAERFARLANRDLASIITDTMLSSLPPMGAHLDAIAPIATLSNEEILVLARSKMAPNQDIRMSSLLAKQRENELGEGESEELKALMQVYQEGWLRQTTALAEAVQRGLMEPMDS
jgi:hypothetical protein